MNLREDFRRQQSILRHRIKHASLPEEHHQHHAGKAGQCAECNDVRSAGESAVEKRPRNRGLNVYVAPRHHSGQDTGDQDVKRGTDQQRKNDSDGQVALRILGFLRGGRNCVKSDVGEKYIRCRRANTRKSGWSERRPVVSPVGKIDVPETETDDKEHDRDLDHYDGGS